jgi:hypothetical protein
VSTLTSGAARERDGDGVSCGPESCAVVCVDALESRQVVFAQEEPQSAQGEPEGIDVVPRAPT